MPRDTWYLDPLKFEIIDNDPAKRVVDAVKLPSLAILSNFNLGQVTEVPPPPLSRNEIPPTSYPFEL